MTLQQRAYTNIYETFAKDFVNNKELQFGSKKFEAIATRVFKELTKDKKQQEKPILIRLAGQSGSGKTTQLMPAIKNALENNNINYIHIAVRLFAQFHPNYDNLLREFGSGLIREKTNGFALMLLYRVVEKIIENKYNILFEVTILENAFEEHLTQLAKNNNYKINYNLLAVSPVISNIWINKRTNKSTLEKNRIVPKDTSDYFNAVLERAVKHLIVMNKYFTKEDKLIMWNAFDKNPIFLTSLFNNDIIINFEKYRQLDKIPETNENELLEAKTNFYNTFILNYFNN